MRRNAHAAVYLGMTNQFQELVYLRTLSTTTVVNNSQYPICYIFIRRI